LPPLAPGPYRAYPPTGIATEEGLKLREENAEIWWSGIPSRGLRGSWEGRQTIIKNLSPFSSKNKIEKLSYKKAYNITYKSISEKNKGAVKRPRLNNFIQLRSYLFPKTI